MKRKTINIRHFILVPIVYIAVATSCEKGWLETKRDLNSVLPQSLDDLEALLNSYGTDPIAHEYVGMISASDDDFYVESEQLKAYEEKNFNLYTWAPTIYPGADAPVSEWDNSYVQVLYANVVLEKLALIARGAGNADRWDNIKGGALFFRAKAFYNVARCFTPPYDIDATTALGIPLRLTSDPNPVSKRASLMETYDQITGDLKQAAALLTLTPNTKINASKQAAYGMLARVYLSMREYEKAGLYADSCLRIHPTLIDYNTVLPGADNSYPFTEFNDEVIFHSYLMPLYLAPHVSIGKADTMLFTFYDAHDLRKTLFFRASTGFRGNYTGTAFKFGGLATDEMLLIRAECRVRAGNSEEALDDLNRLLRHRYMDGRFSPYVGLQGDELLKLILKERRKELLHRGLRWDDLRRLNQEAGYETTLVRVLDGVRYELPPNDPRYTLPIPDEVIKATGMPQNIR